MTAVTRVSSMPRRRSGIDPDDPRLFEPGGTSNNDGRLGRGDRRRGAYLLLSAQVVEGLRAGAQHRIPADSDWFAIGARCACGRPVEWNMPGLEWPVCEPCLTGAVEILAVIDSERVTV